MEKKPRVSGSTMIAPEVIETIIKMTAMETDGVSKIPAQLTHQPVRIRINEEKKIDADVYVRIEYPYNVIHVGKKLQENINRVISETIGMEPGSINIHIEDIDYINNSDKERSGLKIVCRKQTEN